MTTLAQLRKAAFSCPETVERVTDSGIVEFAVHEEWFVSMDKGGLVELRLPASEAERVLGEHSTARPLGSEGAVVGACVPIGDINGQQLNHWVRRAWLSQAPERLAKRVAAGDAAAPGGVGDLPKSIGGPATRALAGAGITTLAQVAALSDAELLAMHGVGPKAVRVLRESGG
ncbi:hypothetical protein [Actinomadura terrae]|uniref:hypothetical protein n=1 Tax=Actinomadura terrae TaxID=604353 RepID=UPI001FA7B6FD|nr:hypothetical protein [Actinomadura terrae]